MQRLPFLTSTCLMKKMTADHPASKKLYTVYYNIVSCRSSKRYGKAVSRGQISLMASATPLDYKNGKIWYGFGNLGTWDFSQSIMYVCSINAQASHQATHQHDTPLEAAGWQSMSSLRRPKSSG